MILACFRIKLHSFDSWLLITEIHVFIQVIVNIFLLHVISLLSPIHFLISSLIKFPHLLLVGIHIGVGA